MSARKRLKKEIEAALKIKNGTALKFRLDYLKLAHPEIFNDCVANVLNKYLKMGLIDLPSSSEDKKDLGTLKSDLRE